METCNRPVMALRVAVLALATLGGATIGAAPLEARQAAAPATPPASPPARPIPASVLRVDAFTNRVWIVESGAGRQPGAFYVFLANGVLVVSQEGGKPAVGSWAEAVDGLLMTEAGISYKVDVLEVKAERFRIRVNNPRGSTEIVFAPAITPPPPPAPPPPAPSPPTTDQASAAPAPAEARVARGPLQSGYRCGADIYGVAFESGKAYITMPDGQLLVMDEITVKDAPASRRSFSNGTLTFVEDTSEPYTRVLFARTGLRPRPCTSMR